MDFRYIKSPALSDMGYLFKCLADEFENSESTRYSRTNTTSLQASCRGSAEVSLPQKNKTPILGLGF